MLSKVNKKTGFKVLLHGVAGVGKTRLALASSKAVIVDIERGSNEFKDITRIDTNENDLKSLDKIIEALRFLYNEKSIETIILDSVTEINKILEEETLIENRLKSLSGNYGAGYGAFTTKWTKLINVINMLVESDKNVILIGHNKQEKIYDSTIEQEVVKENLDVHHKILNLITANFDAIYFLRYEKVYNSDKNKASATGRRELLTKCFDESVLCKNRYEKIDNSIYFDNNDQKQLTNFWKGLK